MDHLVLYAPHISPYLTHSFIDGSTPIDHVIRRVETLRPALPSSVSVHLLCGDSVSGNPFADSWNIIPVDVDNLEGSSSAAAFRALHSHLPDEDGAVILSALDAPFFDVALARYLYTLHHQAWCDYTFADGFPVGYAVEVLRRGVITTLAQLAETAGQAWTRSFVFDALSSDINAFDVETEAASEDLGLLRLSVTVDTRGNYALCRRLVEHGVATTTDPHLAPNPASERYHHRDIPLLGVLQDDFALRRTLPFYYQIQITDEMPQRPSYLPWDDPQLAIRTPGNGTYLDPQEWDRLVTQIAAITPEAVISIGYRGEPSLHPEFPRLVRAIEKHPGLQLYVETSGLNWSDAAMAALQSAAVTAVIVELDSVDPQRYQELRGHGFSEATSFLARLQELIPGRIYAQATRMKATEWELQTFFRHWDAAEGVTPLIQKYNSWAGRLPDQRVVDLAPLPRIPCWHLQRDMVIRLNGDVPRCFQDLSNDGYRGNVFDQGVEVAWERGAQEFVEHSNGDMAPMCEKCDEYYTFNA